MRLFTMRSLFVAGALILPILSGCGGKGSTKPDPDPDPDPTPGVVVSSATPANGNGTLSALSVTLSDVTIAPSTPGKRMRIRGVANAKEHKIDVIFAVSSSAISSVTHTWGTDVDPGGPAPDAVNMCTTCATAQVQVDQVTKKATFTNLVLPDGGVSPGNTSTLNGVNTYP